VSIREQSSEGSHTLFVERAATVRKVSDSHAVMLAALREGRALTVDLSGATLVDAAFAQLLFSARRSFAEAGLELVVVDPEGLVDEAFPASAGRSVTF